MGRIVRLAFFMLAAETSALVLLAVLLAALHILVAVTVVLALSGIFLRLCGMSLLLVTERP